MTLFIGSITVDHNVLNRKAGSRDSKEHREALHTGRRLSRRVQTARPDVEDSGPLDTGIPHHACRRGLALLELGGGNGSIAEWLAAKVSPSGSVTAIDINPVLLELLPAQNLSVQHMDVRTGELRLESYDLVTCRALLHQIAEYGPQVLARMAQAVRPGGWLLIQEPDFNLAPTTEPEVWARTWECLIEWGHANGIDWLIGRKLPSMVAALGLWQPQAKTDVHNIRGRDCCISSCSSPKCATA
jgi:2-polyprenyl-3-methyl-5-hydroxy-6-metoxy-1,4-benzoquinol methylase